MAHQFAPKGRRLLGFNVQDGIRWFFGGNAGISFGIIFLICLFLAIEALRFFPAHHRELSLSRKSGQEYVDYLIRESREFQNLVSLINQAYYQELDARFGVERGLVDSFEILLGLIEDGAVDEIDALDEARGKGISGELEAAESAYREKVGSLLENVARSDVDTFGRLDGQEEDWEALLRAAQSYDPVTEEVPDLVREAGEAMDSGMSQFRQARELIAEAGVPLRDLRNRLVRVAREIKEEAVANSSAAERKEALLEGAGELEGEAKELQIAEANEIQILSAFPFEERIKPIREAHSGHVQAVADLRMTLKKGIEALPDDVTSPAARELVARVREVEPRYLEALDESLDESGDWQWNRKVTWTASVTHFFFGREWKTASDWRQVYGFLPLMTGSLIISTIALVIAVPFSIGAAIYVNQLASKWEQTFMKPAIEMIQAIPSIVLGFFGIMVLGNLLVEYSASPLISWLPGFPITERLNMLNAGMLLALMAVPTVFTLCEDALNNIPRSYSEASFALGASKLQTVNQVVVPAALSGICAAVLLGFGRIIGETMVVLLVAGNKIAMPEWSAGLGVITQPAHTMTGMIAQEMGDVSVGTLHYRGLFLVGLVLFCISLAINMAAHKIIKRLGSHV